MSAPYPWLEHDWQALGRALAADTLGHAYLVTGRQGLGKLAFATAFAGLALCESPRAGAACGACRGCALFAAGNHPDLKIVTTEDDRTRIVIDQIRALSAFYALKPHYGGRKITLICPAELMNGNAANALLKILEEPPSGALLVLITHRPGQLPATINSRCQKLAIREPDWPSSRAWLEHERAHDDAIRAPDGISLAGAPLALREQLSSGDGPLYDPLIETLSALANRRVGILEAARAHAGGDIRRLLDALELIVQAIVLEASGQSSQYLVVAGDRHKHLQEIANKLNSKRLFLFLDRIASARTVVLRSSGVRGAEIVEDLFYSWARATQSETKV